MPTLCRSRSLEPKFAIPRKTAKTAKVYRNILVPLVFDHGERGAASLKVARTLLDKGGTITLMTVLEDIPEDLAQHHEKEAMAGLKEIAESAGGSVRTVVIHGRAYSRILQYSKNHDTDCIVTDSHKPGFEDYFLGSRAPRVVRHAKCGVHVLG